MQYYSLVTQEIFKNTCPGGQIYFETNSGLSENMRKRQSRYLVFSSVEGVSLVQSAAGCEAGDQNMQGACYVDPVTKASSP